MDKDLKDLLDKQDKTAKRLIYFIAAITLLALGGTVWITWYKAGVQSEVYRRQGVEMTQWEVFLGMKTAERTINIKEIAK